METKTKQILVGVCIGILAYMLLNKKKKNVVETTSKAEGNDLANTGAFSYLDGEFYSADGDFYGADGNYYDADGSFLGADGSFLGADGDFYSADGDFYGADGDFYGADGTYESADGDYYGADDGEFEGVGIDERDTMSFASGDRVIDLDTKNQGKQRQPRRKMPQGAKAQLSKGLNARKQRKNHPRKRFPKGRNVGAEKELKIWQRKLQSLLKAQKMASAKVNRYAKGIYGNLATKIAQAKKRIAILRSKINTPQNRQSELIKYKK